MGPHPAVAAIRLAVRRVLHDILTEYAASQTGQTGQAATATGTGLGTITGTITGTVTGTGAPAGVGATAGPGPATGPGAAAGAAGGTAPAPGAPAPGRAAPRPERPVRLDHPPAPSSRLPEATPVPPAVSSLPRPANHASHPSQAAAPAATGPLVLVACSGGADSMALASALAFEARKLNIRAGGITVDHGLQDGSDLRAAEVANRLATMGLDPVEAVSVRVGRDGGPEAAARDARYAALDAAAERHGAVAVLLGHTRDDQAETVLLGLARGSGIRSLSGMAAVSGHRRRYRRPFLELDRQTARKACLVQALPVWDDPHNADPAYTRSRLRHEGLPALEKALGKGVVEALARTAQLSRDDADALDTWAADAAAAVRDETGQLDCAKLYALPPAVRRRVLRRAAIDAGSPAGSLFARHVEEVDRLITGWRGQGAINLPGRVEARRQSGRLVIRQG
ncbi:tRNA lysidine(34) synthetase TilS [Streptomyces qinzhouensis]|uniref:tRNA(Ile)-lysidine synthase n=1 Tax=Streptomyces qinzhouensis TaxID=2599401 RepID=A0A5B8JAB7_9ACTN|nr:tRNA lysidine(34) synthetase TilS [Streptomyces qinzhouensis]QDY78286.1 tRNA lysidine(34) synthetase TilS [Streptomyces qinzhouensis]